MTLERIETAAASHGLQVMGGFHGSKVDGLPDGDQTLILLGPAQDFWDGIQTTPEHLDAKPDPIDRWSRRVFSELATTLNANVHLPFGGPPYAPFLSWALKSGRAWSSPVGMLVHDTTGLMVSFRGALSFKQAIALPTPPRDPPCMACNGMPCKTACPVSALGPNGYDTDTCHAYLETPDGVECLQQGCIARRACPTSRGANRTAAQSAHHMAYFHPQGRTP